MDEQIDFKDIAPYSDAEFKERMANLVKEPGFEHAVKYVMPDVDFPEFCKMLCEVPDNATFQREVMLPFLKLLEAKTTKGVSIGGLENIDRQKSYTFMSNHRDIVLDASFLNLGFLNNGYPTSEVAIGNNLLIYDWITDLVKLNKSFIVKRNLKLTKALEAAKQLSAYIHYAINQKHESVWIAQREGRAKDSNDRTQEALVKMLALSGGGSVVENLQSINIVPVSITYEYDPNDHLKAREFLLRKLDPEFKKSPHDDLLSMETGLLQPKGHVHFEIGRCINSELAELPAETEKIEIIKRICSLIDCNIHMGYKIYPINYVAYDKLNNTNRFESHYTPAQAQDFMEYVEGQLDKVRLDNISTLDRNFMREMMLVMYSNPLKNKLSSTGEDCHI
ncbi:MAG: acyltransferase [Firmicutes bacterium]|nr:acyltransferase [Bacillota bacterium]MCM1400808.1 acyltransferase [Bacteroides sp.]MCM1477661.1 acyltransferase [Bacteroides sp.]